jgi:hypothetical protein
MPPQTAQRRGRYQPKQHYRRQNTNAIIVNIKTAAATLAGKRQSPKYAEEALPNAAPMYAPNLFAAASRANHGKRHAVHLWKTIKARAIRCGPALNLFA